VDGQNVREKFAVDVVKDEPKAMRRNGREWALLAFFLLIATLFYAPLLLGLRAFPDGDFVHHFFPFSLYQFQAITEMRLPVWNPYTYGGHPFLADVQAAVFYPISNVIYGLTLFVSDAAARFYLLEVEAVLHTALGGWFAYLWTRDLSGSRWGGIIGGATFALSGYVTGYAPLQLAVLRTAIWLPLLFWCLGRGWQQPRQWRWWLGSVIALSTAFLAGHSQSFMLLGYAAAFWVWFLLLAQRPIRVAAVIGVIAVVAISFLLVSAQWLPSLEFVRYSVRANVDYAFVSGGLGWADFWQLLLPAVLTQYSPLYIGVAGATLAVIVLYTAWENKATGSASGELLLPRRAGMLFCLCLTLFGLLASLGGNGPLYPILYRIAPGWSWFRGQERAAYLVVVGLCGLAAYGMAAIPELSPQTRRRAAMVAGVVVVAVVYAFGLLWQLPGHTAIDHATYLLVAGVTLLGGLATALMVALPGWSTRRSTLVVALAVANLIWANAGTNQQPGSPQARALVAPEVTALVNAVHERPNAANGLPGRVYNEYRAYDDYGMRSQIEDVWGSSPLRLARYSALFDQFPLDRMWRLLGVEHILTWRHDLFGPSDLLAQFPQEKDTTYLHRLPEANPRAWVVSGVEIADDSKTLAQLADHQFDLDKIALLGPENSAFGEISAASTVTSSVVLVRRSAESYDVTVQSSGDGLLLVSDVWLPGWEIVGISCNSGKCPATDVQSRPYFSPMRADLTLLGIWVPVGKSSFTLRYHPQSVRLGLSISGITLLCVLLLALWHSIGRRRRAVT
jgi:hypothetical protein